LFRVGKGSDAEGPGDPATLLVRIKPVFRQRVLQHLFDAVVRGKLGFLRNIADARVAPQGSRAFIRRFEPDEDLEQS
jgi:hypothetical protein